MSGPDRHLGAAPGYIAVATRRKRKMPPSSRSIAPGIATGRPRAENHRDAPPPADTTETTGRAQPVVERLLATSWDGPPTDVVMNWTRGDD